MNNVYDFSFAITGSIILATASIVTCNKRKKAALPTSTVPATGVATAAGVINAGTAKTAGDGASVEGTTTGGGTAPIGSVTVPGSANVVVEQQHHKSVKTDSLAARKPEVKVAKRAEEIVQRGPVSKKRGDYKTMNITSIDFDESLTKDGSSLQKSEGNAPAAAAPPPAATK